MFLLRYSARNLEICRGMAVYGSAEFRGCTAAALSLLQRLGEFDVVRSHLAAIRQGKRSGVTAWAARPVFTVGTPTWSHSSIWYAGAIAHDAYHAKLYHDAKHHGPDTEPDKSAWSGAAAERACLAFQRQVLIALDAHPSIIDHIERHARNPAYQGAGRWLDYRNRWW
jgi:hypothetical protein